ncbi:hypothetical protein Cyrtocomes_00571 [Candidatus Cyrtobacter comes]|uniref:Uncharacterized protein n=1 Tax=Candidatus Cyrtobacter comes TaxID=675776 RepID=A0ABU5L7U8_9RICK|nr:hypothetical protein [Candidatus Cyrtobacter comes]
MQNTNEVTRASPDLNIRLSKNILTVSYKSVYIRLKPQLTN